MYLISNIIVTLYCEVCIKSVRRYYADKCTVPIPNCTKVSTLLTMKAITLHLWSTLYTCIHASAPSHDPFFQKSKNMSSAVCENLAKNMFGCLAPSIFFMHQLFAKQTTVWLFSHHWQHSWCMQELGNQLKTHNTEISVVKHKNDFCFEDILSPAFVCSV